MSGKQAGFKEDLAGPSREFYEGYAPAYIGGIGQEGKVQEEFNSSFPESNVSDANEGTKGVDHVAVDMSVDPEKGAPPNFAEYEANFIENDDGDIISHDPHLNKDGEALYRFLLNQSLRPPTIILHCSGSHLERRTRINYRTVNGQSQQYIENYTQTVSDFSFEIDVTSHFVAGPVQWSMTDNEPTYRGQMVRQFMKEEGLVDATDEEVQQFKNWESERTSEGLPPWISKGEVWNEGDPAGCSHLESPKTVRQWADEYCSSRMVLKEFVYEKFIHGWNLGALEQCIRLAVVQSDYRGNTTVGFRPSGTKIFVRSDNALSRALSKTWVKVLLWITLIYPFIWLFKRFSKRGGGRWEVCGGAYGLKHLEPIGIECPLKEGDIRDPATLPTKVIDTAFGPRKLIGIREGEWYKEWEETIKRSVRSRLFTAQPLVDTGDGPVNPAHALDGYND